MTRNLLNSLSVLACLVALTAGATAQFPTVPFVEDFENGVAGWRGNDTFDALGVAIDPTGGVDGSALLTTDYLFDADSSVVFRGQVATASSGNAFAGNYNAGGPKTFSFSVTHDAPIALEIGLRFTTPFNFPGGFAAGFDPVAPNELTELSIDINPGNLFAPNLGLFGDIAFFENPPATPIEALTTYNQIFGNVGAVQITATLPDEFAVVTQELIDAGGAPSGAQPGEVFAFDGVGLTGSPLFSTFTLGLDNVTLVPEPGSALLVLMLGAGVCSRVRRV